MLSRFFDLWKEECVCLLVEASQIQVNIYLDNNLFGKLIAFIYLSFQNLLINFQSDLFNGNLSLENS